MKGSTAIDLFTPRLLRTDIGIIVTELVLNSIKHIDLKEGSATISIRVYPKENNLAIEISNPAAEKPPSGSETDEPKGMLIVDSILSHTNGTKAIRSDGEKFIIESLISY